MNTYRVTFAFKVKVDADSIKKAEEIARSKISLMLTEDLAKQATCMDISEHFEVGLTREEFDAEMGIDNTEPDPSDLQSADDFNPDIAEGSL
jgi:hypothetical protein